MGKCNSKEQSTELPSSLPQSSEINESARLELINQHVQAKTTSGRRVMEDTDNNGQTKVPKPRLKNVFAAPIHMVGNFVAPYHRKNENEKQLIRKALKSNFIFNSLDKNELTTLLDAFESRSVHAGEQIITQGEVGDFFYVLEKGNITVHVDGEQKGVIEPGQSLGEVSLLYDCPRTSTCIAAVKCKVWRVDQTTFRKILANQNIQDGKEVKDVLRKVPFLSDIDESYIDKMASATTPITFKSGDIIIRKGDIGKVFYIIKEGKVKLTKIEAGGKSFENQILGAGDYMGERAILTDEPRAATAVAATETVVLCIARDTFLKVLGPLRDLVVKSNDKKMLQGIPIFANSDLVPHEYSSLMQLIDETTAKKGDTIYRENETTLGALYFVRSGRILLKTKTGKETIVSEGGYFGEDTLKREDGSESLPNTSAIVQDDAVLGVLTDFVVESIIMDFGRLYSSVKVPPVTMDKSIAFTDLKKYRILGMGTFGKVWLVSNKKTGNKDAYALKVQRKKEIIKYNQVDGVIREKQVMEKLAHPFIIRLVNSYQDIHCVYMLLNLVQGGELYSRMHTTRSDKLPESEAQFYSAVIFEGLCHMHNQSILYRDLKPENVLIDAHGYAVIVDLGFAKVVSGKTYTLCGTPLYLAPEVILSRGHNKGCDIWSLGVMIYEMLIGDTPFYSNGIDQIALFKKIVKGSFTFPTGADEQPMVSTNAQDLINKALVVRPFERLGNLARGEADIKDHAWFSNTDFTALANKKVEAPWKPNVKDALDVSAFDSWKKAEAETKTSPPTAKQQLLFQAFDE